MTIDTCSIDCMVGGLEMSLVCALLAVGNAGADPGFWKGGGV